MNREQNNAKKVVVRQKMEANPNPIREMTHRSPRVSLQYGFLRGKVTSELGHLYILDNMQIR